MIRINKQFGSILISRALVRNEHLQCHHPLQLMSSSYATISVLLFFFGQHMEQYVLLAPHFGTLRVLRTRSLLRRPRSDILILLVTENLQQVKADELTWAVVKYDPVEQALNQSTNAALREPRVPRQRRA